MIRSISSLQCTFCHSLFKSCRMISSFVAVDLDFLYIFHPFSILATQCIPDEGLDFGIVHGFLGLGLSRFGSHLSFLSLILFFFLFTWDQIMFRVGLFFGFIHLSLPLFSCKCLHMMRWKSPQPSAPTPPKGTHGETGNCSLLPQLRGKSLCFLRQRVATREG